VVQFRGSELLDLPGGKTVHELGLADLLATLHLVIAEPPEIVVLGVQPETTALGTALSPAVESAMGLLVDQAVAQLVLWARPRPGAFEPAAPGAAPQPFSGTSLRTV
jgi:hydrogenase maturation protease